MNEVRAVLQAATAAGRTVPAAAYVVLVVLAAATATDITVRRIPNALLAGGFAAVLIAVAVSAACDDAPGWGVSARSDDGQALAAGGGGEFAGRLGEWASARSAGLWVASALVRGAFCYGLFLAVRALAAGRMGLGDVKLAGVMGAALSPAAWYGAVLGGAVFGLLWLGVRPLRAGGMFRELRGSPVCEIAVPFAPCLFVSTVGVVVVGL